MKLILGNYEKTIDYCNRMDNGSFFEFLFAYASENETFREINRFIWESKHLATRFKNKYRGAVVIDLSEWCGDAPNKYFDAFMYFIKGNSDDYRVDFISQNECPSALLERLDSFFDIEIIDLGLDKHSSDTKIGFYIEREEKEYV